MVSGWKGAKEIHTHKLHWGTQQMLLQWVNWLLGWALFKSTTITAAHSAQYLIHILPSVEGFCHPIVDPAVGALVFAIYLSPCDYSHSIL